MTMSKTNKVEVINELLIRKLFGESLQNKRRRINYNLHDPNDPYQRFVNVINVGSYMRPHRHAESDDETFTILQGTCLVVIFDGQGGVSASHLLNSPRGHYVVDIPGGHWHTVISLLDGTAILETKKGPYDPKTAKEFALWAPEEGCEDGIAYLQHLLGHKVVRACTALYET